MTEYVEDGFNRAERLNSERKNTVGFCTDNPAAQAILHQRQSNQSLVRRTKRLQQLVQEERLKKRSAGVRFAFADAEDFDDFEDAPSDEVEAGEEEIVDQATPRRPLQRWKKKSRY